MIALSHVSKRYPGGYQALHDVGFTINPGRSAFIPGPSGAGDRRSSVSLRRSFAARGIPLAVLSMLLDSNGPAHAAAPGVNLSWGSCLINSTTQNFPTSGIPGMAPALLVVSFRLDQPMSDFVATSLILEVGVDDTELPPCFDWGVGGASEGVLRLRPVGPLQSCTNPYAGAQQNGGYVIEEGLPTLVWLKTLA